MACSIKTDSTEQNSTPVCRYFKSQNVADTRVHTLFSTKNSRTFQGLSRTHFSIFQGFQKGQNQANIMPHQMLKVESAPIFISDT